MRITLVAMVAAASLAGCSSLALPPHREAEYKATQVSAIAVAPDKPIPKGDQTGLFASRMLGHWQRKGDITCQRGPLLTRDGPRLVIATPDRVDMQEVESDSALETHTRVLDPAAQRGQTYKFTPEFNATSATRSFNLIVENTTSGSKETWTPCETG